VIRQLRALGITISLDDFGTGYASIGFLRRFELDRIKLDRSYVVDLADQPASAEVARAIVALARTLSLPVTAEGVETAEQAALLSQIGCARLQGWLFGRAVDALSFERDWLQGKNRPLALPGYGSDNVFTLPIAAQT
jgi:EAL domain-containing protein (putative c-di-GMP-specific phosphodiesterase class I)